MGTIEAATNSGPNVAPAADSIYPDPNRTSTAALPKGRDVHPRSIAADLRSGGRRYLLSINLDEISDRRLITEG